MGDKTYIPKPNMRVKRLNDIVQNVRTRGSISITDAAKIAGLTSIGYFRREGYLEDIRNKYPYIRIEDGHLVFDHEEYESYKTSDPSLQAEKTSVHEYMERIRQAAPANGGDSA